MADLKLERRRVVCREMSMVAGAGGMDAVARVLDAVGAEDGGTCRVEDVWRGPSVWSRRSGAYPGRD